MANQQFQVYSSILFQDIPSERNDHISPNSMVVWGPMIFWRNPVVKSGICYGTVPWRVFLGIQELYLLRSTGVHQTSGMEELWQIHQLMLVVYAHYLQGFFRTIPGGETPIFSSINSSIQYRYLCRSRSYLYITRGLLVFSNDACVDRCTYVEIDTNIPYTSKFCIKSTWVHINRLWRCYTLEKGLGS